MSRGFPSVRNECVCRIEPIKEYVSEEIKEIRRTANLTQRTLAEFLGVSSKAVEAWESGRNVPSGPACRLLSMIAMDPTLPERVLVTANE